MNADSRTAPTLEQALFERMGVSVDDVIATGTDLVDETVSRAAASGVEVDVRIKALAGLLEKLTCPETTAALHSLIEHLPQIASLTRLANEFPNLLAAAADYLDADAIASPAFNVVDNAARSLSDALRETNRSQPKRIGVLGLIKVLRDPAIQKSLAFAIEFGKCFGRNLEESAKTRTPPTN